MRKLEEIKNNKQLKILTLMQDEEIVRVSAEFTNPVDRKMYFVIFTSSLGWEHASVSQKNKTPTWDIMCRIKDIFWNKDECCVEYHPKEEDYINNHEYCLHIWRPTEIELPQPPSIMVGLKGYNQEQVQIATRYLLNNMTDEEIVRNAEKRGIKANRDLRRGNR